jgi:hypothetical protein
VRFKIQSLICPLSFWLFTLQTPWMSLNLKTKIQGLECPGICKEVLLRVLKFFLLQFMDIFWNSLTFKTDILLNWFCMFISHKAVWNSLKFRFEQFNVTFYLFLTPFLQYLVLELHDACPWIVFADAWPWHMALTPKLGRQGGRGDASSPGKGLAFYAFYTRFMIICQSVYSGIFHNCSWLGLRNV